MPKVSIVVPIYGVEKYIERCAKSLFEQTFDDIEYIFVNDCTPDASVEVLNSLIADYPDKREQIKILHHDVNRGLPQARKTGNLEASGEYIINFDSDDWVDTSTIEVLYNKALQDSADIVIFDINKTDGYRHVLQKGGDANLSKWELFDQMCQMNFPWSTCNKLIKRSLFSDIIFPICNNAEDMALILQLMAKADRVSYVPQPFYYYYYNPQSMTKELTEKQVLKIVTDKKANNEIVFNVFQQVLPHTKCQEFIVMFKWQVKKLAWNMLNIDKRHYKYWKSVYSEINFSLFFNSYISIEDKLKCILTHLRIYPFVVK